MRGGEDGLSNLPDELLQAILCLMPLKYAIRTSTLSKRWIHLWQFNLISSTSLQFGEDFSCNQSPKQFAATLDRYLQLHGNKNLDKFGILFSPFDIFLPDLEKWVRTVLGKGVKELDIDLSQGVINSYRETYVDDRMPFLIPNSLFSCNSLTNLSLSRCTFSELETFKNKIFSEPFDFTNFVCLNSLSLYYVNLTDEMLTKILETCVSLESISLKRCEYVEVVKIVGDKLKLKKFAMVDCRGLYDIEIWAPNLESFVYHGLINFSHVFGNISKVNDAYFCSLGLEDYEEDFSMVLSDFSHVKVLTICSISLMHIIIEEEYNEDDFLVELRNLQELQLVLDSISEEHLHCIFFFFRHCPSPFLEKLFIRFPSDLDQPSDLSDSVNAEKNKPNIVFQNLKFIKITNFGGSPVELKMVKFLLEKATVLESIFLVMKECEVSNDSLFLRIVMGQMSVLPKASKDARIIVSGPFDRSTVNPTHTIFYHQEKYQVGTTLHLDYATMAGENFPLDQQFL